MTTDTVQTDQTYGNDGVLLVEVALLGLSFDVTRCSDLGQSGFQKGQQ